MENLTQITEEVLMNGIYYYAVAAVALIIIAGVVGTIGVGQYFLNNKKSK